MTTLPTSAPAVELPDGQVLPYIDQGDPDGLPLVLLHGVTDSHRSFEPVLAELPASIRALAITQRGHGDASKPLGPYSGPAFAADVVGFLDALGIDRAIVAGHSMGSWVASRVAAAHPDRVLGAVLAGFFPTFRDLAGLREEFSGLTDPIDPGYAQEWQESTLAQPVPEPFMAMVVEETCKVPARVWAAAAEGMLADALPDPASIAVPVLLAWGERDAFIPRADQVALRDRMPGARELVYAGAGHALHWEQPARFARDVMEFAATI
jgi:pimeloyl-ACP methyl ester carboxylesterase